MLQCLNKDCEWNDKMGCNRIKQYFDKNGVCTSQSIKKSDVGFSI